MPVGEEGWIWSIVIDGRVWSGAQDVRTDNGLFTPEFMSVSKGQTGSTIFLFEAPDINLDDAQICYRGQEPYSFGKLIGGDRVAVYDWDLKKVAQEVEVAPELKVADMWGLLSNWCAIIYVQLEATPTTKVGYYNIELQAGKESFLSKRVFWKECSKGPIKVHKRSLHPYSGIFPGWTPISSFLTDTGITLQITGLHQQVEEPF